MKSSNLRHCRACSQNKGLSQTRGESAGCGPAHPLPEAGRQAADSQSRKERGTLGPRDGIPYQTVRLPVANQVFRDPGWLTSIRRVAARDQRPRRDTQRTWDGTPTVHPGNRAAGTREVIKRTARLGRVCLPTTWSPELLGPGKGMKHRPNRVCASVEYPRTWTWAA